MLFDLYILHQLLHVHPYNYGNLQKIGSSHRTVMYALRIDNGSDLSEKNDQIQFDPLHYVNLHLFGNN